MSRDHRDLVIEQLGDDEALLREKVAVYRMLVVEALHLLRAQLLKHTKLQADHYRLLDEYRRLREFEMKKATAA